ncbi:MAG: fibronectin type III domain-containing protein [Spirochaetales bacterium]|nr:fibronectin type III domain-containing protein [Spirochaetales bacterium]
MKYILILLIILPIRLFALSTDLSMGGNSGWAKLEKLNNIELYPGKGGYSSLGIKSSVYKPDKFTDLLIHFDDSRIYDASGNYTIESQISTTDMKKVMGNGSGVFRGSEKSVTLFPGSESMFSKGQLLDSFSIEFWLNPSKFSENSVLISYQGTLRDKEGKLVPQELVCSMKDRKLTWEFKNLFYMNGDDTDIRLRSITSIIPDIWHHHLLRFDSSTGLIEYLVDGELEAVQYSSYSGTEDGSIHFPMISASENTDITLGKNFTGYMDEIRISRSFIQNPVLFRYQGIRGNVVSQIIDLGRSDSILEKIMVEHEIPEDSAIFFHYSISDKLEDMFDETKWMTFSPTERILNNNRGKYLRIKLELHPDGEEILTPIVSDIQIRYIENLPPLAPAYLHAEGKHSSVLLSWPRMSNPDIEGYLVYYGTKKGVYFGSDALEGSSPLLISDRDITSITVHGLTNGELYHFTIAAYDGAGIKHPGDFSKEITCRPDISKDN